MASNPAWKQFILDVLSIWGLGTAGGQAAASGRLRALQNDSFKGEQTVPLSPQEAAAAVVKNETTGLDMAYEAALSGVSGSRFQALVALQGNPPGPETLLDAEARGVIGPDDVKRGLLQGFLKDEWIPMYTQLLEAPLPAGQIVEALVQGQTTEPYARATWKMNRLRDADFDVAYATAGNPPGDQTVLLMLNRGIIDEATATQALKESRLKDKYISAYLQLARRRIPTRTLNTLISRGAITEAYALHELLQLGYNEADAEALIKSATTASSKAAKELTEAQIVALYEANKLSQAEAVAHLGTIGYAPDVATEILQLGDTRALLKIRDQVVTSLRTRFVGHRIDENTARADLLAVGLPEDQIAALLVEWKIEQTANPRELTEAQIRAAVNANVLTVADYTARLVAMGYTESDAAVLTQTHFPTTGG
jgi:hypothetical protein